MEYPVKCKKCELHLSGPVSYCPFCGEASDVTVIREEVGAAAAGIAEPLKSQAPTPAPENYGMLSSEEPTGEVKLFVEQPPVVPKPPGATDGPLPPSRDDTPPLPKPGNGKYVVVIVLIVLCLAVAYPFLLRKSTSSVTIVSRPPGAEVSLDGNAVGNTPVALKNVPAGRYSLVIARDGYQATSLEVNLQGGRNPDITVNLSKQQPVAAQSAPARATANTPNAPAATAAKAPQSEPPKKITNGIPGKLPPASAGTGEKAIEERINKALNLFDNGQFKAASKEFRAILTVVPNNALVKFYLQRSIDAEKQ